MSLLEDVFLENEAGEAQELERIIEGDEYDERARNGSDSNENSEKEDEAEEDKRRVDPSSTKTKRVVKNPRFILNPARLTGPRGIQVIPDHFKDIKFKGKGHEKEDLDMILKKLEHWAYRLYPKFKFEDCLKKIETLGRKRPVMVHLHKIRSDQLMPDNEDTVVQKDSSDDEVRPPEVDEFDQLLQQQIDLARATPAPGEKRSAFNTPAVDKRSPLTMPKATSSPSISDEQKERMMRNRKLAEERRLARLKALEENETEKSVPTVDLTDVNTTNNKNGEIVVSHNNITLESDEERNESRAKRVRPSVIESSDEDDNEINNEVVTVDVHKTGSQMYIDLTDRPLQKSNFKSDEVIDLDKEVVRSEHKKKNAIVSDDDSDDENGLIINENTTNTDNIIDMTDKCVSPNNVGGEITAIDITTVENGYNTVQSNVANNLSESEDECDVSVQETVTVDVHESDVNKRKSKVVEEQKSTVQIEKENNINNCNTNEAEETSLKNVKDSMAEVKDTESLKEYNSIEIVGCDSDKNCLTNKDKENSENVKDSEMLDDLMDVDFNEDF